MLDVHAFRRDSLIRYLARHTTAEVRFDDPSRRLYSTDASHYRIMPLGVVIPRTPQDLACTVQIASEIGVPIIARGGGTSLTGQSIGPGIVIDCSKYMNALLEVDPVQRRARLQPGLVLDHLNRQLQPHGLMFGPDVATANRATLGGMIGNNSAGSHSIVYGQTVGHIRELSVLLSDGTPTQIRPLSPEEHEKKLELRTLEGQIYRTVQQLLATHADEINRRFPRIIRKVSGYNLLDTLHSPQPSLVPLLVGSEGTLGVTAEIEVNLVPRPRHLGLLVPQFDSLRAALEALPICLEMKPSAVELLDKLYIDLARGQRSLQDATAAIVGHPAALLMVEISGDEASEVADKVEKLHKRLRNVPGLTASVIAIEPKLRNPLWNLRGAAVPLLYSLPGEGKPITFCEDTAVSPEKLPEFADRFRAIFHKHGTDGTFYGHASVGCLHIRPILNLHDPRDVKRMRAIMEDVTDLVLEFGGSLSGEHGDGLVRSEWNRKMFGPEIYEVFRQIKRAFDPGNMLNPGKIVDAPTMEENFRIPAGVQIPSPPTILDFSRQGGFFPSIELCNGAGVCRKTQGGAMCPSYRATRDERDSTRGRANALRIAIQESPSKKSPLTERWLLDVMDLCLSCKACKTECPSNVDLAKLKSEFLNAHYAHSPRPLSHLLVKNVHDLSPWASRFAGLANWSAKRPLLRRLMESVLGIDRRRSLPEWHHTHFRTWFDQQSFTLPDSAPKVLLLDDCFTTFQEPQIGQAAVQVLTRLGYRVELLKICCGRAMISKGFLPAARTLAQQGIAKLTSPALAGLPILGLEPSCLLSLVDEWPELVPGAEAKRVAARARLAEGWIAEHWKGPDLAPPTRTTVLHTHCHQKALVGSTDSVKALQCTTRGPIDVLDAGCCGMAGAFGYEKKHYDLSVQVANLGLIPSLNANPDSVIVATGTSCRHQIRDLTGRIAMHPVECMAEVLR